MCKRAIISAVLCATNAVPKTQSETSKPSINRNQQYPKRYSIYILSALSLRICFHNFFNYCGKFCNYKFAIAIPRREQLIRREKNKQDAKVRCLLLTSVSTCFGHHYAHLQENKVPVTAFGVLFWFCWMWLVAVVGRCLEGCEHYEGFCSTHGVRSQEPKVC